MKKLLTLIFCAMSVLSFSKEKIKVATVGFTPMINIVEIAKEDLEKQGYEVVISKFNDYITPDKALTSKEVDANFIQHKPFMEWLNAKNNWDMVQIAPIYDVYVAIYSKKFSNISEAKKQSKLTVAIPNDPTNMDRALRMLASENLITLDKKDNNYLYSVKDIVKNNNNLAITPVSIGALVQAYQEFDLVFNWPSHMLKIGVNPLKDGLILEAENGNKYAVSLVAREDNKNDKKILDLKKAMTSEKVRNYLKDTYSKEGYPVF